MKLTPLALDVTAIGMLSSVGHDALTACAAIRAGISRPAPIAGAKAYDLAAAETIELTGHPIEPITTGFTGTARWLQMVPRAFDDLVHQGKLPPPQDRAFWASTAVQLLLPDVEEERFQHDERSQPTVLDRTFLHPLLRRLPATLSPRNVLLQPLDRIGLALVLEGYRAMLEAMEVARMIVLAVDSYVCPFALDWLGSAGKLKGDLNPVGVMPGEAAAAVLLEPGHRGSRLERPSWAHVVAVATSQDSHIDDPEARPRGRELAAVIEPLIGEDTGDLHVDLNGEVWRAKEYGEALVHLGPRAIGGARLHHAAAEIGETGAAAFVVSTVLAVRSLQRGYACGRQVAVVASAETGEIGGVLLRRAEGS